MEEEKKRWNVTYTKHIKQKRKVYQDGFLDVYISTNKVKLYDDCEKLLECKILKNDEAVSAGETFTFASYLVDIGDPVGSQIPPAKLNNQTRENGLNHKPSFSRQQKFSNSSNFAAAHRKPKVERNNTAPNSLSPTQKIIREFKKSELHKYGEQQTNPDTTKSSTLIEWQVLYTAQLTQKAKKYHDGFLQLSARGSMGRQVTLFDANRKQLDGRFLKKYEVIRSNESIALAAYLVEVGECEQNSSHGNNGCISGKMEKNSSLVEQGSAFAKSSAHVPGTLQNDSDVTKHTTTEWEAMYTAQVTQRAKKYHDGFLKLANNGCLGRQVVLFDATMKVLCSRYLRKDEVIHSGEEFAFSTHLVSIGELKENSSSKDFNIRRNSSIVIGETEILVEPRNHLKADRLVEKGEPQSHIISKGCAYSTSGISKPSNCVVTNKPLRNAHQILNILQKPMAGESIANENTANRIVRQASAPDELQDSDASKGLSEDNQVNVASLTPDGCNGNVDKTGKSVEGMNIKDHPDHNASIGIPSASHFSQADNIVNCHKKTYEEPRGAVQMEECPSFDLGF